MQFVAKIAVALLLVLALSADAVKTTNADMAPLHGLTGEACTDNEYKRYKSIVCSLTEACGCTETLCEQDWCNGYMRKWKKEFGACTLKGCPPAAE
mmetsp:Transcript_40126/g.72092  ORF Transcript_40126/g.72092 Transcript_40126/m.72092 type:complete len:96 (+) Transcript_40126:66-353(+)|eukprot:CAMPEP_0197649292 /NCGR_PEP_ID=MMETSP1338-20131121/28271_1 /TAXON_ID=43686 ORGANISM="Pelagodinium beii, Strain RCC1491" /NCGR_SAMPLE_ID=MMETSP1338 /ASSEMBLY_ACC=CAM_ASM_000754 /LENGTH=95 /DNA_ID=CAMNT_0043223447 /DNA_START=64 /DNA_END=351 /DNA_ORIENTATION=-